MEQAVEQHCIESKTFEVKMNQVLNENERLLEQVMSKDIVNLLVNSSMENDYVNVHECQKCLKLETELQTDFLTLNLNRKFFKGKFFVSNQSVPSFDQLFELNELKAQSQEKDTCNGCMLSDNHDLCVLNFINIVNARAKSRSVKKNSKRKVWKPTGKVVQIVLWYLDSGCSKHMTGDRSQLTNFVNKFLGTVKFDNDHVAKIMGYGDYQIGNVTISRVYYVEGLGYNLFSVG
ncbi:hypothetical protein Tco_1273560 [Tanacetum coccineum]